jgi:hypothetical protein
MAVMAIVSACFQGLLAYMPVFVHVPVHAKSFYAHLVVAGSPGVPLLESLTPTCCDFIDALRLGCHHQTKMFLRCDGGAHSARNIQE